MLSIIQTYFIEQRYTLKKDIFYFRFPLESKVDPPQQDSYYWGSYNSSKTSPTYTQAKNDKRKNSKIESF